MTPPLVSVGLPVYNGEKYLRYALDSLLTQDFDDFEVIISDNASTDETSEICRAYAAKDRRIQYYRNASNIGSGPNYVRVFELARGQLFKWLAYDDVCYPRFLSCCCSLMQSAPADVVMVYPRCEFIGAEGEVLPSASDCIASQAKQPYRRLARVLRRVSRGGPITGLIRAEYLRQTLLAGAVSYWDDLLLAELSLFGEIWEVPEVLGQVRCHPGNAVAVASVDQGMVPWVNPSKANRKTRRALLEWVDPSNANRTIWLPIEEERCWEYLKRVQHVPLSAPEKVLCYLTVPAVCYWRRFVNAGGRWKASVLTAIGVRRPRPLTG
jgi:hypothetical protein